MAFASMMVLELLWYVRQGAEAITHKTFEQLLKGANIECAFADSVPDIWDIDFRRNERAVPNKTLEQMLKGAIDA